LRINVVDNGTELNRRRILFSFFSFSGNFEGVSAARRLVLNAMKKAVIYFKGGRGCTLSSKFEELRVPKSHIKFLVVHSDDEVRL
jgi:hypothetical protein